MLVALPGRAHSGGMCNAISKQRANSGFVLAQNFQDVLAVLGGIVA